MFFIANSSLQSFQKYAVETSSHSPDSPELEVLARGQDNQACASVGELKWREKLQGRCGPLWNSKLGATLEGRAG